MKIVNDVEYFSGKDVSNMLDRSYSTIRYWYDAKKYYEENCDEIPEVLKLLPEPKRDLDTLKTRYWNNSDIKKLKKVRDSIKRGDLSEYGRNFVWGKRGKVMNENKRLKEEFAVEKEKEKQNQEKES